MQVGDTTVTGDLDKEPFPRARIELTGTNRQSCRASTRAISGASSSDPTPAIRSTMGLAGRPGTAVLPM